MTPLLVPISVITEKLLCFYIDEILLNSSAGHLVMSKPASDGEGGIAVMVAKPLTQ